MMFHFTASSHPESRQRLELLIEQYGQNTLEKADTIIVLGGDGQMLHSMREAISVNKPIFGMNCGRVGFLMNDFASDKLKERVGAAISAQLHPLRVTATDRTGLRQEALAINEVSLLRQTHNAAHCSIYVNEVQQMELLVCDGVMIATPAGSTAYNLSAHGPILPVGAGLLALTPISAFRPRRWRGALLPADSTVRIEVQNPDFRPQSVTADNIEFRDITTVTISQASDIAITLLHDKNRSLSDRIISEQFQP